MSHTVTLREAAANLTKIVGSLGPGDEVVLTENDRPVAKIVGGGRPEVRPRKPGNCRGLLTILTEDEEHLADFGITAG